YSFFQKGIEVIKNNINQVFKAQLQVQQLSKKFPLRLDDPLHGRDPAIAFMQSINQKIDKLNPNYSDEEPSPLLSDYRALKHQRTELSTTIKKVIKEFGINFSSLPATIKQEVINLTSSGGLYYTDTKIVAYLFKNLWRPNRENLSLFLLEKFRFRSEESTLMSTQPTRGQYDIIMDFANAIRIAHDPELTWNTSDSEVRLRIVEYMFHYVQFLKKAYDLIPDKLDFNNPLTFFRKFDHVYFPSIFGTKLICIYQEIKYDIRIEVGTIEALKKLFSQNICDPVYGFIKFASNEDLDEKHVTPLLVFPKFKIIFSLDSICKVDMSLQELKDCHFFNFKIPRQADRYNCRNDAINILSNALSFMKKLDIDLSKIESKQDLIKLLTEWQEAIPAEFLKACQRKEAILAVDATAKVRSKKGLTLAQKIADYQNPATGRREYLLKKGAKYAAISEALIKDKAHFRAIWKRFNLSLSAIDKDGFSLIKSPFLLSL
ncbi:MAG: hypothetical protein EBS19_11920, partial [Spirochaetia bacterium]|nr:hypothetical protein [Spirochaetia bacterium]